jgi:WD40 repeat protein
MGCAASKDDDCPANSTNRARRCWDEAENEGDTCDDDCNASAHSRSIRSVTTVRNTRGHVASSSVRLPYLLQAGSSSPISSGPSSFCLPHDHRERSTSPLLPETFNFGDFVVEKEDVARQRRERVSRHAARGSGSVNRGGTDRFALSLSLSGEFHESLEFDDDEQVLRTFDLAPIGFSSPSSVLLLASTPSPENAILLVGGEGSDFIMAYDVRRRYIVRRHMSLHPVAPGMLDDAVALFLFPAQELFGICFDDGSCLIRPIHSEETNSGASSMRLLAPQGAADPRLGRVTCAAPVPDGSLLLTGDVRGNLRTWNLKDRAIASTINLGAGGLKCLTVAPGGSHAAAGSSTGVVLAFNIAKPNETITLALPADAGTPGAPVAIDFVDDTTALAVFPFVAVTWSIEDGRVTSILPFTPASGSPASTASPSSSSSPGSKLLRAASPNNIDHARRRALGVRAGLAAPPVASAARLLRIGPRGVLVLCIGFTSGDVLLHPLKNGRLRPDYHQEDATIRARGPISSLNGHYGGAYVGDSFGNVYCLKLEVRVT